MLGEHAISIFLRLFVKWVLATCLKVSYCFLLQLCLLEVWNKYGVSFFFIFLFFYFVFYF